MNGFADLAVVFGGGEPPTKHRLTNPWSLQVTGPGGVWTADGGGARVSTCSLAASPRWQLWVVGDLYSYRGSSDRVEDRLLDDLASGRQELRSLDAHAVVVAWDADRRHTHVLTDRLGTAHVYVGASADGVRLGTFAAAVAGSGSDDLDWEAITGFCGFGFYPSDRTMYRDVRILRPATWTTLDERGAVVRDERYWNWSYEPDESRSEDDLLDEFHDIFTRTVRSQVHGHRAVVPLSGGLDSRTVFAAADDGAGSSDVRTFTYGYSPRSPEIAIASRVARARGGRAEELVVEPYLFDRLDDVVGSVEGFGALTFSRQAMVAPGLRSLGDRVVGGHWGDVWFDRARVPAQIGSRSPGLVDIAMKKFVRPGSGWLLDHLCRAHLGGADPESVLRGFLERELAMLPDLGDGDMQLTALKTEQWSFRWTLSGIRAYQLGIPTLLPFYANDVVDYFLRVPMKHLERRHLQIAYLIRHHPDLAAVTWQSSGMPLHPTRWDRAGALVARAARKADRTITKRPVIQRNWEVQYLDGPAPARLRSLVGPAAARLDLPGADVDDLLASFLSAPDGANGYAIDALATLAAVVGDG